MPKISELPSTSSPTTADSLPIVQGSTTKKTTLNDLPIPAAVQTALNTKTTNSAAAITGGTITGITDLAVADGGTGASTAAGARSNLGFTSPIIDRAYGEYTANVNLTTILPVDDTIPQNTEGTQIISVNFTPKSTTSRLRLRFQGQVSADIGVGVAVAIFSSASASAIVAQNTSITVVNNSFPICAECEYVPGVITPLTFTVRIGPSAAANVRLNGTPLGRWFGGSARATLIIEEIAV